KEPIQTAPRYLETSAAVPLNALVKTYHMPGRFDKEFYEADLISDVLGRGKSSRLYQSLLKNVPLFNSVSASITASLDPGLLMIRANLNPGVDMKAADEAIEKLVEDFAENGPTDEELDKVKNQAEASLSFAQVELLNRAMNLAYAANAGNAEWVNEDEEKIRSVTKEGIQKVARRILRPENCSTLYYHATQPN
ncbi:MAG: insulinase family protein, partial [Bacteroidetes bacterium]|nr:insulinase family protein [Bacteroidota bacterium]